MCLLGWLVFLMLHSGELCIGLLGVGLSWCVGVVGNVVPVCAVVWQLVLC